MALAMGWVNKILLVREGEMRDDDGKKERRRWKEEEIVCSYQHSSQESELGVIFHGHDLDS